MKRAAPLVVVCAVTAAAFARSLGGGFVYDDRVNVPQNARLTSGEWSWIFTDTFGHYMPVTWLTIAADHRMWGLDPFGYHLTNVLFHVANAALFYLVVLGLIGDRPWAAAVGALLFAVHPMRVESVAWITERRDVVMGFFALLSVLAYLRGGRWTIAAFACFVLALLSKTMAMTLPVVFVLLDVYVLKRRAWRAIPFVALMLGAVALTWVTQRDADAIRMDYPAAHVVAHPGYRFAFYLWKTAVPVGLSPLYFYRASDSPWALKFILGAAATLAGTVLLWRRRRERPAAWTAWLCYGALIAPVIGVVQAGPHFAADRYTYLACMPWAVLAAAAWGVRAAPLIPLYVGLTLWHTGHWKSDITLWERAVAVDPNGFAHYNLGTSYHEAKQYDMALQHQTEAIRFAGDEWKPYFNRAAAWRHLGHPEEAERDYTRATELAPAEPDAWRDRGRLRFQMNDTAGAVEDFTRYIELWPADPAGWAARAAARKYRAEFGEAAADYTQALARDPGLAVAWTQRGETRLALGDAPGAVSDLDEAVRLVPRDSWAHYVHGLAFVALASWEEADRAFGEAIRLVPEVPEPYVERAAVRRELGDRAGAAADARAALDRAPNGWVQRARAEAILKECE